MGVSDEPSDGTVLLAAAGETRRSHSVTTKPGADTLNRLSLVQVLGGLVA